MATNPFAVYDGAVGFVAAVQAVILQIAPPFEAGYSVKVSAFQSEVERWLKENPDLAQILANEIAGLIPPPRASQEAPDSRAP